MDVAKRQSLVICADEASVKWWGWKPKCSRVTRDWEVTGRLKKHGGTEMEEEKNANCQRIRHESSVKSELLRSLRENCAKNKS